MKFSGYKYTFRTNALHRTSEEAQVPHSHTFIISLYVQSSDEMMEFNETEDIIKNSLDQYEGKVLNDFAPFDKLTPTVENFGDYLFTTILHDLKKHGLTLVKLEIGETPYRIYTVKEETLSKEKEELYLLNTARVKTQFLAAAKEPEESLLACPASAASLETLAAAKEVEPVRSLPDKEVDEDVTPVVPASSVSFLVCILVLLLGGVLVTLAVYLSGIYPLGLDIHGHLFKADLMYHEIKSGNLYPLYSQYWYNGLQVFRYWPPMPYYFLSLLQFITGGNVINAYLGFIFCSFFIGGFGWLMFGRRYNRPVLGLFFGILWFFLPDNLRVFFGEGNFPRMFITMLLPLLFYCLWQFVDARRRKMAFPLLGLMLIAVFGHLMISAMIGVGTFVFMLIYAIVNRRWKEPLTAILIMLFSFAVAGIWVYPALQGGITAMGEGGNAELMASLATKLSVSLNPFLRLSGKVTELYFGVTVFILSLLGLCLSNKRSLPGFASMLIVIAGTTTALTPIIQLLPLSQLFWVRRFTPIAYAMFVIAVINWRKLKKVILIPACVLLLLDCIPSTNLSFYNSLMNIPATEDRIEQSGIEYQFEQAKEITQQRISLMDLSYFGPLPSYYFGSLDKKVPYVFGWAWQGAATAENIVAVNEAFENQNYDFMFDRHVELGADTIIVDNTQIPLNMFDELDAAAERSGYRKAGYNANCTVYSLFESGTFGVITDYKGISIGTTAAIIPQLFPYFVQGDKMCLDDYTFEQLSVYEKIYLSGFFYNSKTAAEELVRELAENGTQVFIDMGNIPSDPLTTRMTFLGVSAQPIVFKNHYPQLIFDDEIVISKDFIEDNSNWNTVYLNNLVDRIGYAWYEDTKLDFIGKGKEDNITFIGFNVLYHTLMSGDKATFDLLNDVFTLDEYSLPERTLVPLEVSYSGNKITITSQYDNVNTTLAWQDNFTSKSPIHEQRNMLFVDKGTTVITLHYPYLVQGLLVTIAGIFAEVAVFRFYFRKKKTRRVKNVRRKEGAV